jgi:hypothetical protein
MEKFKSLFVNYDLQAVLRTLICAAILILPSIFIVNVTFDRFFPDEYLRIEIVSPKNFDVYQTFYDVGNGYNEDDSIRVLVGRNSGIAQVDFKLPGKEIGFIRIDPGGYRIGDVFIRTISLHSGKNVKIWYAGDILRDFHPMHDIGIFTIRNGSLYMKTTGSDPYFGSKNRLATFPSRSPTPIGRFNGLLTLVLAFAALFLSIRTKGALVKDARFWGFIVMLFSIFSFMMCLSYISRFGTNITLWDDWEIVPILDKFRQGTLGFSDLFAQHNEHRPFFPRIIFLLFALLTKFNAVVPMFFTGFLLLASLIFMYLKLKDQFGFKINTIPFWFVMLPFLIFNWRQSQNMLWQWQVAFVMPLTFSVLTFYFIELIRRGETYPYFVAAVVSATIATYSSSMGLFVWPAVLLQLFLKLGNKKHSYKHLFYWAIIAAAQWMIYFLGYNKPVQHPNLLTFVSQPGQFAHFFLVLCGNISMHIKPAADLGMLICFLCVYTVILLHKNHLLQRNSFWLALGSFSMLTLLSIAVGRMGFGDKIVLESRYSTYSIPLIVSLYVMMIDLFQFKKYKVIYIIFLAVFSYAVFTAAMTSYAESYEEGMELKVAHENLVPVLLNFKTSGDPELSRMYPHPDIVRERAFLLEKWHYSVFSQTGGPK